MNPNLYNDGPAPDSQYETAPEATAPEWYHPPNADWVYPPNAGWDPLPVAPLTPSPTLDLLDPSLHPPTRPTQDPPTRAKRKRTDKTSVIHNDLTQDTAECREWTIQAKTLDFDEDPLYSYAPSRIDPAKRLPAGIRMAWLRRLPGNARQRSILGSVLLLPFDLYRSNLCDSLPPLDKVKEDLARLYKAQAKCIAVCQRSGLDAEKYWMVEEGEDVFSWPPPRRLDIHSLVRHYLGNTFDALLAGEILAKLSKHNVVATANFETADWRTLHPSLAAAAKGVFGKEPGEPFLKNLFRAWHKKAKEVKKALRVKEQEVAGADLQYMIDLHREHERIGTQMKDDIRARWEAADQREADIEAAAYRRTFNPDPARLAQLKAHDMVIAEAPQANDEVYEEVEEDAEEDGKRYPEDEQGDELDGAWLEAEGFLQKHEHETELDLANRLGLVETHIPGMRRTRNGAPFQLKWVQWLALCWLDDRATNAPYLALDPGLGKTVIMAAYIALLGYRTALQHAVVICQATLIGQQWEEFDSVLESMDNIVIASHNTLRSGKLVHDACHVFIDEAHEIRSRTTAAGIAMRELCAKAKRTICLSGTPMHYSPTSLLHTLYNAGSDLVWDGEEEMAWSSKAARLEKVLRPRTASEDIWSQFNVHITTPVRLNLRDAVLRVSIDDTRNGHPICTLPDVQHHRHEITFEGVWDERWQKFQKQGKGKDNFYIAERQYSVCPAFYHLSAFAPACGMPPKMIKLVEILKGVPEDEMAVIHLQQVKLLDVVQAWLSLEGIFCSVVRGRTKMDERQEIFDDFRQGKSMSTAFTRRTVTGAYYHFDPVPTRFLIISTVGTAGLNLQRANHSIMVDVRWSQDDHKQAHGRVYRLGQEKTVHTHVLVAESAETKMSSRGAQRARQSMYFYDR